MNLGPKLEFRQTQTLVMTPQLRQAIQLLQFSNREVDAFVEQELEKNPLLERVSDSTPFLELPAPDQTLMPETPVPTDLLLREGNVASDAPTVEGADDPTSESITTDHTYGDDYFPVSTGSARQYSTDEALFAVQTAPPESLADQLTQQLRLSRLPFIQQQIGMSLISYLDPAGRLDMPVQAIAETIGIEPTHVENVRKVMMQFEPVGLFATDLRECLAAQLSGQNRLDPAMDTLLNHLPLIAAGDLRRLQHLCGVDANDIDDMLAELRALNPKPGAVPDVAQPVAVVPDILMQRTADDQWSLELNPETTPRVVINSGLHTRAVLQATRLEQPYISENMANANWLIRSLQQRATTILRVSGEIMRHQKLFLDRGVAHMAPLTLRDVADALALHESTISRVTAGKYIATPRGVFELKYFFTTALTGTNGQIHSAEAVRHKISRMIHEESEELILSDDDIVLNLKNLGIDIARRTVAKYRGALNIPNSVQRKRDKTRQLAKSAHVPSAQLLKLRSLSSSQDHNS